MKQNIDFYVFKNMLLYCEKTCLQAGMSFCQDHKLQNKFQNQNEHAMMYTEFLS